ncbi:MAG: pyridoxal phosphate-dependent aminotransferase [Candidatus Thorarchaeota archaeon]
MEKAVRLNKVKPSGIRAIFTIANKMRIEGKRVIDFGLGDVNLGLPTVVKQGIIDAINEGKTSYGPDPGEPKLREKLSEKVKENYKVNIPSSNIMISCGAMESLFDTFLAYINPGDEVIIHQPSFGNCFHQILLAGGIPKIILSDPENDFLITAEMINEVISQKTKMLLINFPTNPTSMIIQRRELKNIVELCREKQIILVSDESYELLYYDDEKHVSALEFGYENTIVISSVSKSLCMTGMRLGFTIGATNQLMSPIFQVHQYNTVHATRPVQYGAIKGLENEKEIVSKNMEILDTRRKKIMNTWKNIPNIHFKTPKAGFYVYINIKDTGMNSDEFCRFTIKNGICLVPGTAFGMEISPGISDYCRLSYGMATEEDIIKAAGILRNILS